MAEGGTERGWAGRNRMALLGAALVVAYAAIRAMDMGLAVDP